MASVIKEPMSPRGDHSVLVWNEEEVFRLPIYFDLKTSRDNLVEPFDIPDDWSLW